MSFINMDNEQGGKSIIVPFNLKKGDRFNTANEFDKILEEESKKCFVQFYKRDSRRIETAKKVVKRYLNPDLEYYQLKYSCVHGGKQFIPSGQGKRKTKTLKQDVLCPAYILLRAADNGNQLEIVAVNYEHNHIVDKVLYQHLPQQRKLPEEIREQAKKILSLKANKHLVRQELENQTGRIITLKDLSNLKYRDRLKYENNVEAAVNAVQKKFGSDCHLLVDTNNVFKGLLFCTPTMKITIEAYPELLCIDATYKLLNIRTPVYLILIEDGNGESQVVAVSILVSEDYDCLKWFLQKFKEINPCCVKTETIMADKDWSERTVFKECFPDANILICIFHVFKVFQREITVEKMKITNEERILTLQLLQELAFAKSKINFDQICDKIKSSVSQSVWSYLEEQWLNIYEEWCPHLGQKILNFLNRTNNRVESINQKLKMVIEKNCSLGEFFEHLFVILRSLENERKNRLAENINKRIVRNFSRGTPEYEYFNYLTEYAFDKVLHQLKASEKYTITATPEGFTLKNSENIYDVTEHSCSCYFFNSMGLPCRHIFQLLQYLGKPIFHKETVKKRWTRDYFLKNQVYFHTLTDPAVLKEVADNISLTVDTHHQKNVKVLSQQQKYRIAFVKCKEIASLASEATGNNFEKVLEVLDAIKHSLQENRYDITVQLDGDNGNQLGGGNQDAGVGKNLHQGDGKNLHQGDGKNWFQGDDRSLVGESSFVSEEKQKEATREQKGSEVSYTLDSAELVTNDIYPSDKGDIEGVMDRPLTDNTGIMASDLACDPNDPDVIDSPIPDNFNILTVDMNKCNNSGGQVLISNHITVADNTQENYIDQPNNQFVEHNYCIKGDVTIKENVSNIEGQHISDTDSESSEKSLDLKHITLPPVYKKRGRPAGSDLTSIGLPKKNRNKKKAFSTLSTSDKTKIILPWILKYPEEVYSKKCLETNDFKEYEEIDIRITEININIIKKFFSPSAFQKLKLFKQKIKLNGKWKCGSCKEEICLSPSVRCDRCLLWFHISCCSNYSQDSKSVWFCTICM